MNRTPIQSYEIIDHGVENDQYFQGCGTYGTPYTDVYTGIGGTPRKALDDALEQAAQCGWDTDTVTNDLPDISEIPETENEESSMWHYVSIRVK